MQPKKFALAFEPHYCHCQLVLFGYLFVAAISLDKQGLILSATSPDERELIFDCDWGWGYYHFDSADAPPAKGSG